jgi:hypothetical protein
MEDENEEVGKSSLDVLNNILLKINFIRIKQSLEMI